jgi:hypothetical protein
MTVRKFKCLYLCPSMPLGDRRLFPPFVRGKSFFCTGYTWRFGIVGIPYIFVNPLYRKLPPFMSKKEAKTTMPEGQPSHDDELVSLLSELKSSGVSALRIFAIEKKVREKRKRDAEKSIIDLARLKEEKLVVGTFKMKSRTREEFRDLLDSIQNQHDKRKTFVALMEEGVLLLKKRYEQLGVKIKPRSMDIRRHELEKAAGMQRGRLEAAVNKMPKDELVEYVKQDEGQKAQPVRSSPAPAKNSKPSRKK